MKAPFPRSFSAWIVDEWTHVAYPTRLSFSPRSGLFLPSSSWVEWFQRRRGRFLERPPGFHVRVHWGRFRPFADRVNIPFPGSGWLPVAKPGGFA